MRKHLLKQLTLALLLTAAVPTLTAQVHVGDILCEGNAIVSPANYPSSGATAIGVVFYVDNTGQHGWAVALQDAGDYIWGSYENDTPLPNYNNKRQAIYDLDGYHNTQVIREYEEESQYSAFYAVDFDNGWYLPAIGQLNYLYGNLIEVNASLQMVSGSAIGMYGDLWYWSSTEYHSERAWNIHVSGELLDYIGWDEYNKGDSFRVRVARNF